MLAHYKNLERVENNKAEKSRIIHLHKSSIVNMQPSSVFAVPCVFLAQLQAQHTNTGLQAVAMSP